MTNISKEAIPASFFVYLQHGGRLGRYRYYDMDKETRAALDDLKKL